MLGPTLRPDFSIPDRPDQLSRRPDGDKCQARRWPLEGRLHLGLEALPAEERLDRLGVVVKPELLGDHGLAVDNTSHQQGQRALEAVQDGIEPTILISSL